MVEEKTIRLSQLARKLNVATPTIITYLLDKGFIVENKPNTKITTEQYKLLANEFADAAMDKEEAADLVIGQSYEQEPKFSINLVSEEILASDNNLAENQLDIIENVKEIQNLEEVADIKQIEDIEKIEIEDAPSPSTNEVEIPILQEPEETSTNIQNESVDFIKASTKITFHNRENLQGITILGKMDLAPKEVKKVSPILSANVVNKDNKRPRKRLVPKANVTANTFNSGKKSDNTNNYKPKQKSSEPTTPSISEKEIQDQIRTTLAKLGGGNKVFASRAKYRKEKRSLFAEEQAEERLQATQDAQTLRVTEFISASDLASLMGISINQLLSTCMNLGMLVSINQRLDAEAITIIADEFGFQIEFTDVKTQHLEEEEESDSKDLIERAPIVTIMGHVDHGKTSLLDYIRNTQITKMEAGGITQHIGAYDVMTESGKHIAFLDTPGHEAFTAMRARGAKLTDIAIIVIAADDGVRPQTKEAINHAKLAGVPIVIAINKIDKPQINLEKVKEELANLNILVEDWGGKYQTQGVSALTGEGVSQLLEKVLFEAELLDLKANANKKAKGTVIEASLDQGRGYLTTIMVQEGTLQIGNVVLAGGYYGKVKAMFDYQGKSIKKVGPSTPIQALGLNGAPQAGDIFKVMSSEREARDIATQRQQILREQGFRTKAHITLDEIGRRLAIGNFKELNLIVKGDVDGSVEALSDSLLKLSTEEVKVNILHKGVGAIVESDILLAAASDAIVLGFQVRPTVAVRKLAEKEGIEIRLYSIIYDAINNIKDAIQGMLVPTIEEVITGSMVVKEIFKITGIGVVAGAHVTEGYIKKNNSVRVIRDGIVIYTGNIKHLKHFKEDMQQIKTGFECGVSINNFSDIKVNDIVEGFEKKEVERKL